MMMGEEPEINISEGSSSGRRMKKQNRKQNVMESNSLYGTRSERRRSERRVRWNDEEKKKRNDEEKKMKRNDGSNKRLSHSLKCGLGLEEVMITKTDRRKRCFPQLVTISIFTILLLPLLAMGLMMTRTATAVPLLNQSNISSPSSSSPSSSSQSSASSYSSPSSSSQSSASSSFSPSSSSQSFTSSSPSSSSYSSPSFGNIFHSKEKSHEWKSSNDESNDGSFNPNQVKNEKNGEKKHFINSDSGIDETGTDEESLMKNFERERMTRSVDSSSSSSSYLNRQQIFNANENIVENGEEVRNISSNSYRMNPNNVNRNISSSPASNTSGRIGCASPEVLVNGSPSPEIVETVGGTGIPGSGQNGGSTNHGSGFGNIEEIQFVGIIGSNSDSKRICRIKCVNGVWVGPLCTLEKGPEIECPAIDPFLDTKHVTTKIPSGGESFNPVSGQGMVRHKVHDKVHFSCLEGFTLAPDSGPEEIFCNSDGHWSHTPPSCIPVQCSLPETDDPNLEISDEEPDQKTEQQKKEEDRKQSSSSSSSDGYKKSLDSKVWPFGSQVYFSCRNRFKLIGSSSSTCSGVNTWSPDIPLCQEISCPHPGDPMNGQTLASGRFTIGDYVEYLCNPGHIMVGDPLAICTSNGTWSSAPPECRPVCEFPGEPMNGYIVPTKFSYEIGDEITIFCKSNHHTHPRVPFMYCNQEGKWSQLLPSCQNDEKY